MVCSIDTYRGSPPYQELCTRAALIHTPLQPQSTDWTETGLEIHSLKLVSSVSWYTYITFRLFCGANGSARWSVYLCHFPYFVNQSLQCAALISIKASAILLWFITLYAFSNCCKLIQLLILRFCLTWCYIVHWTFAV